MSAAEIKYIDTPHPVTGLTNGKLGIWLFLASEVMLFGALFSTYVLLRKAVSRWLRAAPARASAGTSGEANRAGAKNLPNTHDRRQNRELGRADFEGLQRHSASIEHGSSA